VLVLEDRSEGVRTAPADAPLEAETTPAPSGLPKLKPGQTVCQGILHVPDPGEPRVFADVYTQKREVAGFTIVGSGAISAAAFDEAERTVERVFRDPALAQPLVDQGAYIIIAAPGQGVLDLPEFACLEGELGADFFTHVCGIADRADYPVVSVNELDLIGDRKGPCGGLNILYHELGHLVQGWSVSPPDYFDIRVLYQRAVDAGKLRGRYAGRNANEYFADGTQAYFHHVDRAGREDRDWLKRFDPDLYALLVRVYGE
jgi:hypothetical protein